MPYDREGNFKYEMIDLSDDTTVTHAPTTVTTQLKPDVGFIYEVVGIQVNIPDPAGSAAGTHELQIQRPTDPTFQGLIRGTTGTSVVIKALGFAGDSSEIPANIAEQYELIHHVFYASNSVPLNFVYINSTDVDQSGTRAIIVHVKKWREAIL